MLFITIYLPLDTSIRGKEIFANFVRFVDCDLCPLVADGDLPGERLRGDFLTDLVGLFPLLLLVIFLDGLSKIGRAHV